MKKWKFASMVMAVSLALAPATVTLAADSTTTTGTGTTTTDTGTTPTDTGSTTTTGDVCGDQSDDGGTIEVGGGTTDNGGTTTDNGGTTTDNGGTTTTDNGGTTTTDNGGGTTTTDAGTTPQMSSPFETGHGNSKHDDNKHDDRDEHGKPQPGSMPYKGADGTDDSADGSTTTTTCGSSHHDNGKHKGWSNKIENMIKHLDDVKKEIAALQTQLDRLLQWAKENGSTTDQDALKQIQDALSAKDTAGEADTDDLRVLAETQDKMNNTEGAVSTLEKALTADYQNSDLYTDLSKKLAKKGDNQIHVYVKGKKPNFDVKPVEVNGRTLVPLRAIGDALGAQVAWDEATQTITLTNKDGKKVVLQVNNTKATVDGKQVTLDVPAQVQNDRTLVPLRALGNFFNLGVDWKDDGKMAILK